MSRGNVQAMRDALDARGIELGWADIDAAVAAYEAGRPAPEYEYGVQRPLSEEAWGPGHVTVAEFPTREEAVADMEYFDVKNGTLVRRRKAGPWEKI